MSSSLDPKTPESLREQLRLAYDPLFRGHTKLMAHRVRTILMVSNSYESFSIERDASLEYAIYGTSQSVSLRVIPQITTAVSAEEGLRILEQERFDLVLFSANLPDMEIGAFAAAAKQRAPNVPVVMLVFDGRWFDVTYAGQEPENIDWIVAWRGNAQVILSIIKLAEDRANVDRDIQLAAVGTILVIEDSVERYSALLPHLFTKLLLRTLELTPEGINESERMVRSRVRPKVLLARTFGEAEALVEKYQTSLLAIISDLRTFHDDRIDPQSGPRFLERFAARFPGLPVLVQSAESDGAAVAARIGARFLDKQSTRMPDALDQFILDDVGFGSFVFRDATGAVHATAANLWDMEEALWRVPDESIVWHAKRNDLSHWFRARGEVTLAELVRPLKVEDFQTTSDLRNFLRSAVAIARVEKHRGVVADFKADSFDPSYPFLVVGKGSYGGKGRGLAFMYNLLSREAPAVAGANIRVPNALIIATSLYDEFVQANGIDPAELAGLSDEGIKQRFLAARIPASLAKNLRAYLERVRYPLAVRSSSILEDSHHQPCAGLYATFFLPNSHADVQVRLTQLSQAIALVYASVFLDQARKYHQGMGLITAEEKMAIVVQEVFGRRHGELFYPTLGGVAQSHNYYPVFDMKPEDGVATIGLGLGKHVVEGGQAVRFCPKYPKVLPQFSSVASTLKASQSEFYALDLSQKDLDLAGGQGAALVRLPLAKAEEHGELGRVGSVVSPDDDRVYEGVGRPGPRVVTFSRQLKSADAPLCNLLRELLTSGRKNLGCALEIEFSANLTDEGMDFAFLQIRPFVAQIDPRQASLEGVAADKVLLRCKRAMGNGRAEGVRDLVYVHPQRFDRAKSAEVGKLVGELNARLAALRRRYVLVGPGRWGTNDPWLGIPASWYQLSAAKVIVEVPAKDLSIEPSQGTHFFHNMISAGVGYLSLGNGPDEMVRWDALDALPGVDLGLGLRHVTVPAALVIRINGGKQEAVIALG